MSVEPSSASSLQHIAIIMDGNRRWARARKQLPIFGHRKGAETLREITGACINLGIPYLTVYAFSTENWQRPQAEVEGLQSLLRLYLHQEIKELNAKGVRLRVIGDRYGFATDIVDLIERAEEATQHNTTVTLSVALNYGSRAEIMRAVHKMMAEIEAGHLAKEDIIPATMSRFMDTSYAPDPDLIIRTSGEQRLSNFLLWQTAYSEFFFTPTLWPDFTPEELRQIVETYVKRERRFGGNSAAEESLREQVVAE